MCVQQSFLLNLHYKLYIVLHRFFFLKNFFCRSWSLLEKIRAMHMCILITKLISLFEMIFETNIFTEMVIWVAVDCKSDIRQGRA